MKNAIPKRKYRERGQVDWRKDTGFLEKKVDWKRRATKYNRDQETLRKKTIQANLKNPEEFYHKMITLSKGKDKEDKEDPRSNKNLLNYHMMKIKKSQRKNQDSLIHEYSGTHVILASDDEIIDSAFIQKHGNLSHKLTSLKQNESKLKIAQEDRRVTDFKLDMIEEKMGEIYNSNLTKKVKKLRTRLR
jgi:hypothetical protein